ncbi:hypothetical protein [Spirosoma harenae]
MFLFDTLKKLLIDPPIRSAYTSSTAPTVVQLSTDPVPGTERIAIPPIPKADGCPLTILLHHPDGHQTEFIAPHELKAWLPLQAGKLSFWCEALAQSPNGVQYELTLI